MSRPLCVKCQRPLPGCLCPWINHQPNRVEVLILQHPLEARVSKNTAGLLHLSLARSHLLVGETFTSSQLSEALGPDKYNLLLYPATADSALARPPAPELAGREPEHLRLVLLDATWRKSRKMLYLNPLLQELPRLALSGIPDSNYRIRKAHKAGQLSTLEACCYALAQLEGEHSDYGPLLNAFNGFIDQKLTRIPEQTPTDHPEQREP